MEPVTVATDLYINWTQSGTEMLLGQRSCQGETEMYRFRLIHMGDWCDSRSHTTKRRARTFFTDELMVMNELIFYRGKLREVSFFYLTREG